jgi:selenocysteine lyase/cysteine desulfurase
MSTPLDLARLRADTPGVAAVTHLNNAGAALMPAPVLDAVVGHLRRESEIGGYEAADEASARLADTYSAVAELIGAEPDEIALLEHATRAWEQAFGSFRLTAGDRVLVSEAEYGSNVTAILQVAKRTGVVLEVIPSDGTGQLAPDALERMIDGRVHLIAVSHVPTHGGLVNPAAAVGAIAREHGIPYLLDACQSVGQMPVDVGQIGCDLLSATGRKFLRGPRGTGFLYAARRIVPRLDPPLVDIRGGEWTSPDHVRVRDGARRFESWERDVAATLGLGAAVRYSLEVGIDTIRDRVRALSNRLRDGLNTLEHVTTHDLGTDRCAIVTFTVAGHPAPDVRNALLARRINVSVSLISGGASRFDFERRGLTELVRASPHYYNNDAEIDHCLEAVASLR